MTKLELLASIKSYTWAREHITLAQFHSEPCEEDESNALTAFEQIEDAIEAHYKEPAATPPDHKLSNAVYAAISGFCERLEHRGAYSGNGHHLAQKLTALVVDAVEGSKS